MAYKIKRMDKTGHTVIECETPLECAHELNQHKEQGYIAYLNGQLFSGDKVTQDDLQGVDNIVLSTPIRGGR